MESSEFRYATLWKEEENDIVFARYKPKLEITIEVARELVQDRMLFTKSQPHYILIDFTNVASVTKEARDYMNDPDGGLLGILGGAFLSNTIVTNVFVNLYLKINQPVVPAKFFRNKDEALLWLVELKRKVILQDKAS
jgi:hypothetical protein